MLFPLCWVGFLFLVLFILIDKHVFWLKILYGSVCGFSFHFLSPGIIMEGLGGSSFLQGLLWVSGSSINNDGLSLRANISCLLPEPAHLLQIRVPNQPSWWLPPLAPLASGLRIPPAPPCCSNSFFILFGCSFLQQPKLICLTIFSLIPLSGWHFLWF